MGWKVPPCKKNRVGCTSGFSIGSVNAGQEGDTVGGEELETPLIVEPKNCTCTPDTKIPKSTTIKMQDKIGDMERGMWGYGGKRDEIPMNDAAGAEAEL